MKNFEPSFRSPSGSKCTSSWTAINRRLIGLSLANDLVSA